MLRILIGKTFTTLACLGAIAAAPASAQTEAAGRFLSVDGEVRVLGGNGARAAQRGSEVRQGETVRTGSSALAQLRMSDGSLLSVRSGSEFKLDQYSFSGKGDSNATFALSVIRGGFRTITGLIAQANRRGYRITTPVATIGVRGTHFEVVHVVPQMATQGAPAGTYKHVFEGITTLQNAAGMELVVNREQTAYASLQPGSAPALIATPPSLFGRPTPVPRAAAPAVQPMRAAAASAPAVLPALDPVNAATLSPTLAVQQPLLSPTAPLTTLQPVTTTLQPVTTTVQPITTTLQPVTTTLQPVTNTLQPVTDTLLQPVTTLLR